MTPVFLNDKAKIFINFGRIGKNVSEIFEASSRGCVNWESLCCVPSMLSWLVLSARAFLDLA